MRTEPTLAARSLPKSIRDHRRVPMTFRVEGGLNYIKGNRKPYFTLTYIEHRKGFPKQCYSGGAGHDTILRHFPQFAQLAALHLSDIDGVPMHAEANGWYNLAGALPGNAGERFHAANSQRHFPKAMIDPAKPWDTTDYRNPTADECLQIFADHARIDIDTAREVAREVEVKSTRFDNGEPLYEWQHGRAWFAEWIELQRPRWKAEAEACIERYGLRVFGDPWPDADTDTATAADEGAAR